MSPFCPQCGIDNPDVARFCDQCGAALIPVNTAATAAPTAPAAPSAPAAVGPTIIAPAPSGVVVCAQCGASAIPGEAFCDNCGAPLSAPSRPVQTSVPAYDTGVPPQPVYPPPQAVQAPPPTTAPQAAASPSSITSAVPSQQAPAGSTPPIAPPPSYQTTSPPMYTSLGTARLILTGSNTLLPFPNAVQAIIGRSDPVSNFYPDIDLTAHGALDHGVGRRHARIFLQGGQVMLEDMDSTNGTLLNGQKLAPRQPQLLRNGDQIQLGRLAMTFQGN